MSDNPDPTKDPEFQKVIRHFVTTPHRPHESLASKNRREEADKASPQKKRSSPKEPAAR